MEHDILAKLTEGETLFWLVGATVAITAIVAGAVKSVVKSVTRERTRREIAAYIAEGTMTPEQGEKLLAAGQRRNGCG
jgi:hypothetical protein